MALMLEWLRNWGRKLSAAEVKKLPVGTHVIIHKEDRHGYHVTQDCVIVQYGKTKRLNFWDVWNGERYSYPIRDKENQAYTLKKE